jgi:hypothetical protein
METVALPPAAIGADGPETDEIRGGAFDTEIDVVATLLPPSPSVTVSETTYEPSSSGVKPNELSLPVAYAEPFFVTLHAYENVLLSTSLTLAVTTTGVLSTTDVGASSTATGRSLTGEIAMVTVPVFEVRAPSLTWNVKLSLPK